MPTSWEGSRSSSKRAKPKVAGIESCPKAAPDSKAVGEASEAVSPLTFARLLLLGAVLAVACIFSVGCSGIAAEEVPSARSSAAEALEQLLNGGQLDSRVATPQDASSSSGASITESNLPSYQGNPSVVVNGDLPAFTAEELSLQTFEDYAPLDGQGRCGTAFALVSDETRPATGEKRSSISSIRPTGWCQASYDFVQGGSLYNRSHLIAWSLGAENANPRNLITGTASMNQSVMQPLENRILEYIRNTGRHVLVRVTPVFSGRDLVARGVQYEAYSVEDAGTAICMNRFLFNVQPGVEIDYATGESHATDES